MREPGVFDLVVVGGGMGGLAAAALAQAEGMSVALLEAHTHLGGCAGWFERGAYAFDAGATALMGLAPGEPLGDLIRRVGLDFQGVPTRAYRVCLPDRTLEIVPEAIEFERRVEAAFPGLGGRARRFWRLQEAVGGRLFEAAGRVPRLPTTRPLDWMHNARVLGVSGLLAASTWTMTVSQVLKMLGLAGDRAFVAMVAMLLQDTAQAGPETVPFANAAACLHAYRRGMSRPMGGMKALAEGLGERFEAMGGELRRGTLVDRVESKPGGGFTVVTRRRERLEARQVVFNVPIDLAARLLGRELGGRIAKREEKSRAVWSAVTGYVAIRREAVADDAPLFHQVLRSYDEPIHEGNNVLVSLSPVEDAGYGPEDVRVATMSTHTRPEPWDGLSRAEHEARKGERSAKLREALERAIPGAADAIVHEEYGSPRSFARYTRRTMGRVGGAPVSHGNSTLRAVGSDAMGPGIWLVGDSVFPGQGTMAVALSAIRVVERLTGKTWEAMRLGGEGHGREGADVPLMDVRSV